MIKYKNFIGENIYFLCDEAKEDSLGFEILITKGLVESLKVTYVSYLDFGNDFTHVKTYKLSILNLYISSLCVNYISIKLFKTTWIPRL